MSLLRPYFASVVRCSFYRTSARFFSAQPPPFNPNSNLPVKKKIEGVKHTIAVTSTKGGVGKSTVAINLSVALKEKGFSVGILDSDIHGPSIPKLCSAEHLVPTLAKDDSGSKNLMNPVSCLGLQAMSIGFLVDPDHAVIWRGPLLSKALEQMAFETKWENLDFLVLDMPPGTGDIHLNVVQNIDITGAIVVSTPQDIALADTVRGLHMFEKMDVPVLGMVQNMAYYICPQCHSKDYIFGKDGAKALAKDLDIPMLGELPLTKNLRLHSDIGIPIIQTDPEAAETKAYMDIADELLKQIEKRAEGEYNL